MVGGVGRHIVSRPMLEEKKQQKGVCAAVDGYGGIRASVLKFPKPNGKDGSLIEGQATKRGYLQ